jgi:hypothetical protein
MSTDMIRLSPRCFWYASLVVSVSLDLYRSALCGLSFAAWVHVCGHATLWLFSCVSLQQSKAIGDSYVYLAALRFARAAVIGSSCRVPAPTDRPCAPQNKTGLVLYGCAPSPDWNGTLLAFLGVPK